MSVVTEMFVLLPPEEEDAVVHLTEQINGSYPFPSGEGFRVLDVGMSGGTKYPQSDTLWGAFNCIDVDECIESTWRTCRRVMAQCDWERAQILCRREHDEVATLLNFGGSMPEADVDVPV